MSKKLGFNKHFRNSGTIHNDKWPLFLQAIKMDGFCNKLFAGTAFPLNEDGNITFKNLLHQGVHLLHFLAFANQPIKGILHFKFSA